MPRKPRLFVPDAVYHVYCRITRGEMVFTQDGEPERLMSELLRVKHRDGLTCFAYAIMGNHYHAAVRTADVPLWRTMLSLQGKFGRGHNRNRGVRGPLWQSRYKARIVEDQQYFEQLLAYIHLNPVAAGLVDDPATYRWSGHGEILGIRDQELVDVDEALCSFGTTRADARKRYLDLLRIIAEVRWLQKEVRALPWWGTVANDEELVQPTFGRTYQDFRGENVSVERPTVDLHTLAALVSAYLEIEIDDLAGRSTKRTVADARILLAKLSVELYGHRATSVAKLLEKEPGSVSRWLAKSSHDNHRQALATLDRYIISLHSESVEGSCDSHRNAVGRHATNI